jgi:hypothetical protein
MMVKQRVKSLQLGLWANNLSFVHLLEATARARAICTAPVVELVRGASKPWGLYFILECYLAGRIQHFTFVLLAG